MKPEELAALAARAKDLVADSERLRQEHQALLKKIAELSKMEASARHQAPKDSISAIAPWKSPALQPRNTIRSQ